MSRSKQKMNPLSGFNNKKIAILGLGMENAALVEYLLKNKVLCEITVCDAHNVKTNKYPSVRWKTGPGFNHDLGEFDILFRSPGWPIACPGIQKAVTAGSELSSPMRLFFELCPTRNVIGVTGTKGKGTTASLIHHMLKTSQKRERLRTLNSSVFSRKTWLGGNIGVAPFGFIDKIGPYDWIVLELSSFQLEDMKASPRIAVLTNFFRDHMSPADPNNPNYHKSMEDYWEAKMNIVRWQTRGGALVINKNLKDKYEEYLSVRSSRSGGTRTNPVYYFGKSELSGKLPGDHNRENIGAAVEAAKLAGVGIGIIKIAITTFPGLPHRLEYIKRICGKGRYYNDSFATTPESAITALKSFSEPIVLIAGGADKGSDFRLLAREINKRVKFAILLTGEATPKLERDLLAIGFGTEKIKTADSMAAAVKIAHQQSSSCDIVLLSPACASFGMFRDYKERGELFKKYVRELK